MKLDSFATNSCYDERTVSTPSHSPLLLFFFLPDCGGKRKQGKTHIVEHNNKRWEIKTADSGEHKKGKDYQEDYGNGERP